MNVRYVIKKPTLLLHPALLFLGAWCMVYILISLQLSELILITYGDMNAMFFSVTIPFVLVSLLFWGARSISLRKNIEAHFFVNYNEKQLVTRLMYLVVFWSFFTIVEVIYSGGLPLLWLLKGEHKSYADFGIPSVHGLLNSIIFSTSLVSFFLFYSTGSRRFLILPIFLTIWGVVVMSRHTMLVNLIQLAVMYAILKNFQITMVGMIKTLFVLIIVILIFGVFGDLRSGGDAFLELARPTENYPSWLPSGFLWIYIYLVTPFNNLINTTPPAFENMNYSFYYTLSQLFPSVIRGAIYGEQELIKGDLVADAFNVSTAFVDSFKDLSWFGVVLYSSFLALISNLAWLKLKTSAGIVLYAIVAQCVLISVFFNHLFNLPVLFQVFWVAIMFSPKFKLFR